MVNSPCKNAYKLMSVYLVTVESAAYAIGNTIKSRVIRDSIETKVIYI